MTCMSYDHVFATDIRRNFTEEGTRRRTVGQVNIPDVHTPNDQSDTEDNYSLDDIYVPN